MTPIFFLLLTIIIDTITIKIIIKIIIIKIIIIAIIISKTKNLLLNLISLHNFIKNPYLFQPYHLNFMLHDPSCTNQKDQSINY